MLRTYHMSVYDINCLMYHNLDIVVVVLVRVLYVHTDKQYKKNLLDFEKSTYMYKNLTFCFEKAKEFCFSAPSLS